MQLLPTSVQVLHAQQKSVASSAMRDYLKEWLESEDGKKYQASRSKLWK